MIVVSFYFNNYSAALENKEIRNYTVKRSEDYNGHQVKSH